MHPVSPSGYSISDLLNWTGGRVANAADLKRPLADIQLTGVSGLKGSNPNQISFFFSAAYKAEIPYVKAGVLITGEAFVEPLKQSGLPLWKDTAIIACADPYLAMALVSEKFATYQSSIAHVPGPGAGKSAAIDSSAMIHATAVLGKDVVIGAHCVIQENAVIGDRTVIYPGCFVGPRAKLGEDCVLFPNVVIYEWVELGNRVRIHASSVIGADGFGYAPRTENGQITKQVKIYHLGRVIIGDDVEIGALTSVDRGTLNDTRIAPGAKIDNNVQVGHNVTIGEGTMICAGVGLAGSSRIGKYVYIAGLAGVSNGILVDDFAKIGPGCLVPTDIPPGKEMLGFPPREANDFFRAHVLMSRMLKEHKSAKGKIRSKKAMSEKPSRYRMNIEQIRNFLPHRAPFLLVDRVLEIHPNGKLDDLSPANMIGTKVVALKNLSYNEPFFQGHFPKFSIFPGVLMIEAMAQASSFAIYPYLEKELAGKTADFECILIGVDAVRFRKPTTPGDSIKIESTVTKCRGSLWAFHCEAFVDDAKVAEADIMANLTQKKTASI